MTKNNISQLDTASGNNSTIDDTDVSGTTGKVKDGDNVMRSLAAILAKFYDDLGAQNTVAGTADAITIATTTVFTAFASGMVMSFKSGSANTGAATLNLDSVGAKAIRKISGGADVALVAGDIRPGRFYRLIYDSAANAAAGAWIMQDQIAAGGVVRNLIFGSSGTYTPHADMVYCEIECVGGGGGGGGVTAISGSIMSAGGGGGGGYSFIRCTAADIGASKTVTIGAAGAAGNGSNGSGGAGGDTSVGSLCIAKGGSAGVGGQGAAGGAGGVAGTGDLTIPGERGDNGIIVPTMTDLHFGARGGHSAKGFGFGGGGVYTANAATNGAAGQNYGGGGGGGIGANVLTGAGGAVGAAGLVIIREYCAA